MVAFRIDDVSLYMDWDKFNRLAEIFRVNDIKPLLGVIPDNQDPELHRLSLNPEGWEKFKALKQAGWMTAQHGYRHLYTTKDAGILKINMYSEFAGVDLPSQREMLSAGKKLLYEKGLDSDIFMAPAHSYDQNTLTALSQLGFKYITDGYSLFPYMSHGLKCIPCQTSKPVKVPMGIITVCLHPNMMEDRQLEELGKWIAGNRRHICDYADALKYRDCGIISRTIEKLILYIRKRKKAV